MESIVAGVSVEGKSFSWPLMERRLREWMRAFLNATLRECQREYLRARSHERSGLRRDWRNGYRTRDLSTVYGRITLRVPRNRRTRYWQGVFDNFSRRTARLEERILDAFALGLSTRGLSRWLEESGVPLSAQGVSNVVGQLDAQMRAWHARGLGWGRWEYVVVDGMWVRLGRRRRVVLMAIGIREGLEAELIDYRVAGGETLRRWKSFLGSLRLRGMEEVKLFVSDGAGAIESALEWVYPEAARQLCVFHKLQGIASNLEDFANRKAILKGASRIYDARTAEEARRRAGRWGRRWRRREGEAVRLFMEGFERTLTYYRFERRAWAKIRTTNVAERYIRELRKRLRPIAAYRSERSIDRMIFAAIRGIAARGYPVNSKTVFTHNA